MALFYLVNWHDADIRAYTWIIASATVSIFCAVLAHSAFFQTTTSLLGGKEYVWVNFVQFLILWASTQCLLLVFKDGDAVSQTVREAQIGHHEESQSLHQAGDGEAHAHTVNVPLKAFGTIMAHITGFAGIRCFLSLQVSPGFPFRTSWYMTVLVIPIFLLMSVLLVKVSRELRLRWVGDKDKEEEADMLWREQCSESEDDAVGLSLSSLTCAALRYLISGDLPQLHGTVTGRTSAHVLSLYGVGLLFAVLVSVATYKLNQIKQQMLQNPGEEISHYADRMVKTFQIWAGLTMSWCFYFATQWCFFTLLEPYEKISHGCAGKLLQAVLVTFCCMLVIFVLDCVGDGSEECKKAFKGVITALGLLVGISWEGSFALAVDEIVVNYPKHTLLMKNLLAFMLMLVVLPAWRLYILPRSDPKIWSYYQGRLPPLMALCKQWDPVKDYKESKTEKWRKHAVQQISSSTSRRESP
uniref:Uncharacterized protein n=1 Tax=Pyrodinium bahamense TaxID=73915 RepID=A0A7S0AY57_9DINO